MQIVEKTLGYENGYHSLLVEAHVSLRLCAQLKKQ